MTVLRGSGSNRADKTEAEVRHSATDNHLLRCFVFALCFEFDFEDAPTELEMSEGEGKKEKMCRLID